MFDYGPYTVILRLRAAWASGPKQEVFGLQALRTWDYESHYVSTCSSEGILGFFERVSVSSREEFASELVVCFMLASLSLPPAMNYMYHVGTYADLEYSLSQVSDL